MAGPPTTRMRLPNQVYGPLIEVFGMVLWFGAVFSVGSFLIAIATLAWQKKSASSTHLIEEGVLLRICIASVILGSASSTANVFFT